MTLDGIFGWHECDPGLCVPYGQAFVSFDQKTLDSLKIERDAPTRLVPLTRASIRSNARYWGDEDDVPREALTCGMATLLEARQILLVVSGPHKREILRRTLTPPPTADVPASWLQQASGDVVALADHDACPEG